ncbi:hypothetical protein RE474_13335 [Methanolobus sediminis]|uniref:Calcineurin-like phosphoesterase domain-containing protein n=1 Tax=Methanolobus sediminis TaxID=3072978 RepID=A0AA51YIZ4_9EURY|nr:hypothetical protein [Methanolobus sediminis]WMW25045.1 hypothetical protein RE474_13335 [Methanolobus sediminis]
MSIVAVSDVHLGMKGAKEDEFTEFVDYLNERKVKHLVLLGDILVKDGLPHDQFSETDVDTDFLNTTSYKLDNVLRGCKPTVKFCSQRHRP